MLYKTAGSTFTIITYGAIYEMKAEVKSFGGEGEFKALLQGIKPSQDGQAKMGAADVLCQE